jgi:rhamnosyltransferase
MESAESTLVSVVIPTWNGMATLPALFDALASTAGFRLEIVIVDSGSDDGTVELAQASAAHVIETPPHSFNHGVSRNRGIQAASAELVVCLVQDAVPASPEWLSALVSPLLRHPELAGTWARQIPADGASALTRFYMGRASLSSHRAVVNRISSPAELDALLPIERMERCRFDNVCSCLRKTVWQSIPFKSVPIAEDLAWAREVLLAGHALAYCPDAVVRHSHDRSALYEYRRTRLLHRQLADLFGVETVPTVPALVRAVGSSAKLHWTVGRRERPARALATAVAWPLGQYLGGRDHRHGRPEYRPRGV